MGLSSDAYHFIGGLKAHAKAYIALTAPTVNSYKRLVVGSSSGSAWAPVYISYGCNNRTQMLRIPAAGRIEDRTVDGSCNPYLAATASSPPASTASSASSTRATDLDLNLHELDAARLRRAGHRAAAREPARRDARAGARRCAA